MTNYLSALVVMAALTGCSDEPAGGGDTERGDGDVGETISGPFPKTIRGTVGYSYPLDDEGGPIKFDLLEYRNAAFIISAADYDARGMDDADDPEVSVTIEPISSEQCRGEGQCFRAY